MMKDYGCTQNLGTQYRDGAVKINQAVPGYFGAGNLRTLTGIEGNGND